MRPSSPAEESFWTRCRLPYTLSVVRPLPHGFFPVKENQPVGQCMLAALQSARQFQQQRGA